jgi:sn-glycerol 3-phosphate transport system ATP-binding protein/multiple sugar transport system ATP-binding protein
MGGQKVNDVDASERKVAMVFQNYALYPHMTVFENMSFALRLRKTSKTEISKRVEEVAEMLELSSLLQRKPRELSGGQRQRVALGRAIVQQDPYFLLDEPLSNLDAQLRTNARNELVDLHEKYPSTMVYVTHDQVEAMTIGQRIAILQKGTVQQIGSPDEIYNRPANRFVAAFIGNPPMNMIPVQNTTEGIFIGGQKCILPSEFAAGLKKHPAPSVLLGIRPEAIKIMAGIPVEHEFTRGGLFVRGEYIRSEYLGSQYILHIVIEDSRLQVSTSSPMNIDPHSNVTLLFPFDKIHFFSLEENQGRIDLPEWESIEESLQAKALTVS